jgi:hypothetical protein
VTVCAVVVDPWPLEDKNKRQEQERMNYTCIVGLRPTIIHSLLFLSLVLVF